MDPVNRASCARDTNAEGPPARMRSKTSRTRQVRYVRAFLALRCLHGLSRFGRRSALDGATPRISFLPR